MSQKSLRKREWLSYNTRQGFWNVVEGPYIVHVVVLLGVSLMITPIVWDFLTAFKTKETLYALTYFPTEPTFDAFRNTLIAKQYWKALLNSVIISGSTTLIVLLLAVPAGYGFSRFRFRFDNVLFLLVIVARMFPPVGLVVPYYRIMLELGLLNTKIGIIIAETYMWLPLMVYIMRNFFLSIPSEMEESARVDGCTKFQAFRMIALPLAMPGIAAVAILTFLYSWREFLFALIVSQDLNSMPIAVAAFHVVGDAGLQWAQLGATAVLAMIPPIILVAFFQKYIVSGLTTGALKG